MKKTTIFISLISLLVLLAGNSSFAQDPVQKIALIIDAGINEDSSKNRSTKFEATLKESGFITFYCKADNAISIKRSIREFGKKLRTNSNSLGLFYYHGPILSDQGQNYFLPPGSGLSSLEELSTKGVPLSKIVDEMAFALNRANFLILDPNNMGILPDQQDTHTMSQPGEEEDLVFIYTTKPGEKIPQTETANFDGLSQLALLLGQEVLNLDQALKLWKTKSGINYFTHISLNRQVSLGP